GISLDSVPADKFFGALSTTPGPTVALNSNTPLNDTATLSAPNPTGTITFQLFAPTGTTILYTNVVTLTGAPGPVTVDTATMGNNSGGFVPTAATGPGTYHWMVTYSGDLVTPRIISPTVAEPQNVVDASISISPLTPVNLVGEAETFTITVTAFPAATGTPTFATPIVTFPGASGTPAIVTGPTFVGISGNVATWTLTINSFITGTFNVQASDTVTMDNVAVTRTTGDGLSGDSPSAIKQYVPL